MSRSRELDDLAEGIGTAFKGTLWPLGAVDASMLAAKSVLRRLRTLRDERDQCARQAEQLAEAVEGFLFGDLEQVEVLMAWLSYQSVQGDSVLDD